MLVPARLSGPCARPCCLTMPRDSLSLTTSRTWSAMLVCSGHGKPHWAKKGPTSPGGPKYTREPSERSSTWSSRRKIAELGWCMLTHTIRPPRASSVSVRMIWAAVCESRPLVGSSRKRMLGLVTSSIPMLALRCSPPLTDPTRVRATRPRFSSFRTCSTLSPFSSRGQCQGSLSKAE